MIPVSRRNAYILVIFAVLGVAGGGAYYLLTRPPQLDAPILKAMSQISSIETYAQYVETEVHFPDRSLTIVGTYFNDRGANRFASISTTTLTIPDQPPQFREHTFTHENISISDDVYVRVDTASKLLKQTGTVTYSPKWRHFTALTIPPEFTDIAVPGPIHDSLIFLSEDGKYLTLIKKYGKVMWGPDELLRYTFQLSGMLAPENSSLKALLERVGPRGTVDVWIDEKASAVRYIVSANADYRSTTTIANINTPQPVEAPIRLQ